jgi:hypothetical protein
MAKDPAAIHSAYVIAEIRRARHFRTTRARDIPATSGVTRAFWRGRVRQGLRSLAAKGSCRSGWAVWPTRNWLKTKNPDFVRT